MRIYSHSSLARRILISPAAAFICLATASIFAQTPASPSPPPRLPQFEVASIRPSDMNRVGNIGVLTYPGGRAHTDFCTVSMLLEEAFNTQRFLIEKGPKWMDRDFFNIDAIPPDSSEARKLNSSDTSLPISEEQRLMMQSLLVDRFSLKYHFETKPGRIYWMVRTGTKTNLSKTTHPADRPRLSVAFTSDGVGQGQMIGSNASMPFIASRLSSTLGFTVIDKTGIDGSFDFDIPPPQVAGSEVIDAAIAGLKYLGLKLKPVQGEVKVLIVDSVSQPSPN